MALFSYDIMRYGNINLIIEKCLVGDVGGMPFFDKILPKPTLDEYKLEFSAKSCKNMTYDQISTLTY